MNDMALETHLDHLVDELRHIYGELPEEELLRRHSDRLFHLDMVLSCCEHETEKLPCPRAIKPRSTMVEGSKTHGLTYVVTRLFSRHKTVEPELDLKSFFSSASSRGKASQNHFPRHYRRYNNESQPLWTLPVLENKIQLARNCSHRLMMTRTRGSSTIYNCARCGFWLDSSQACLEDAVLMWIDYVDSWDKVWKNRKENVPVHTCVAM